MYLWKFYFTVFLLIVDLYFILITEPGSTHALAYSQTQSNATLTQVGIPNGNLGAHAQRLVEEARALVKGLIHVDFQICLKQCCATQIWVGLMFPLCLGVTSFVREC